jgi:hypothetical protein
MDENWPDWSNFRLIPKKIGFPIRLKESLFSVSVQCGAVVTTQRVQFWEYTSYLIVYLKCNFLGHGCSFGNVRT